MLAIVRDAGFLNLLSDDIVVHCDRFRPWRTSMGVVMMVVKLDGNFGACASGDRQLRDSSSRGTTSTFQLPRKQSWGSLNMLEKCTKAVIIPTLTVPYFYSRCSVADLPMQQLSRSSLHLRDHGRRSRQPTGDSWRTSERAAMALTICKFHQLPVGSLC